MINNIKGFAVAQDGNLKRIAATYDKVDERTGKPLNLNVKMNVFVTDNDVSEAIELIQKYIKETLDNMTE